MALCVNNLISLNHILIGFIGSFITQITNIERVEYLLFLVQRHIGILLWFQPLKNKGQEESHNNNNYGRIDNCI